jgi:hypothetical protein
MADVIDSYLASRGDGGDVDAAGEFINRDRGAARLDVSLRLVADGELGDLAAPRSR